jgi:geranylgeranyl pyrophosphate synthase
VLDLNLEEFYFNDSYIKQSLEENNLESLSAGKHMRHMLLERTGNYLGINQNVLLSLGRIGELVHNATLTHDDVIDESHTRRGHPSIPAQLKNKKSVLLGDYILAKALTELSEFQNTELINQLAFTLRDLVEGEWIQMEHTNPYEVSREIYEKLAIKKTGSLLRWCFVAPATYIKLNTQEVEVFSKFGEQLGVLYQITDDIIDFTDSSKKTKAIDVKNNNINYVLHIVGELNPHAAKSMYEKRDWEVFSPQERELIDKAIAIAKEHTDQRLLECQALIDKIFRMNVENKNFQALNELDQMLNVVAKRIY